MPITRETLTVFSCGRCPHRWLPKNPFVEHDALPRVCPKCKSPYWNSPRKMAVRPKHAVDTSAVDDEHLGGYHEF